MLPWVTSLPAFNQEPTKTFPGKKVSLPVYPPMSTGGGAGNMVKNP
jgi:hypothetical protein